MVEEGRLGKRLLQESTQKKIILWTRVMAVGMVRSGRTLEIFLI